MDEKTYAFAVETTAQIEVLRGAVAGLTALMLGKLPKAQRDELLAQLQEAMAEMPPGAPFPNEDATPFHEDVAAAAPAHAERFASEVRHMLG